MIGDRLLQMLQIVAIALSELPNVSFALTDDSLLEEFIFDFLRHVLKGRGWKIFFIGEVEDPRNHFFAAAACL